MAEKITAARPYARALFDLASSKDALAGWSERLETLELALNEEKLRALLDAPTATFEKQAELVIAAIGDTADEAFQNLIRLLAHNDRLALVAEIRALFDILRAEREGTAKAEVVSAQPLNDDQLEKIQSALKGRLGREISLTQRTDDSLVAGAIIRAGDLVIDGSVRGRLEKLATTLIR